MPKFAVKIGINMDKDMRASSRARLFRSTLQELRAEQRVLDYGAVVICRCGEATIHVDFKSWTLREGAVITLFPNDVVAVDGVCGGFEVEMLRYDPSVLREASLQLEHTVYHTLRTDRCRSDNPIVTEIVDSMFALLRIYFRQPECRCTNLLVLLQLKAFFAGFYDYIVRHKPVLEEGATSRRQNELFNQFMELLQQDYRLSHEVSYYADRLCITPKYLNAIVRSVTQRSPKVIIDHYVILQLKLLLRQSDVSVKQLAWDFHFSDSSFFCRYFKQHTGMTPQEWRKA